MRTRWRKHWPKCYTCEFLGKAWRACMKNQASTNLYMYIMLLNIVNAKCWMQEQLDIQLQSLVSYLISSRDGSSHELDLTRLDILLRYWVGSRPNPTQLVVVWYCKSKMLATFDIQLQSSLVSYLIIKLKIIL